MTEPEHPIAAYYREKSEAFSREWEKVREAIKRGAPPREIEELKRAAERAGYTGD